MRAFTFNTKDFRSYVVTGVDCRGRRFRITTGSWMHADGINLWRGHVWGVGPTGRRTMLKRVRN
jgi:hypothetical protein